MLSLLCAANGNPKRGLLYFYYFLVSVGVDAIWQLVESFFVDVVSNFYSQLIVDRSFFALVCYG